MLKTRSQSNRLWLGCLLLLLWVGVRAWAQDPQETKLLVLEHMWNEAQVQRDAHALDGMIALAEACLADYDEDGWRSAEWLDPGDVAFFSAPGNTRAAE